MKRQTLVILLASVLVSACAGGATTNQLGATAERKAARYGVSIDGDQLSPSQAARINSIRESSRSDSEIRAMIRSALRPSFLRR